MVACLDSIQPTLCFTEGREARWVCTLGDSIMRIEKSKEKKGVAPGRGHSLFLLSLKSWTAP